MALIPARGGSKRLPRKNLLTFSGQPLIYHSIALARSIAQIGRCVVSTEDREIADVARQCGADVIERPVELADDRASTASVATHALATLASAGAMPEILVLLQPNCPLRPRSLVERALIALEESDADSVISVSEDHRKVGTLSRDFFKPEYAPGTRSQDMAARYFENGVVYVTWAKTVMRTGSVFGERIRAIVTDPLYALGDIDTALDFAVAEYLFQTYRSHFEWPAAIPVPAEHQ